MGPGAGSFPSRPSKERPGGETRGAPPSSGRRLRPPRPRVGRGPSGTSRKRGNNGGRGHHFGSFPALSPSSPPRFALRKERKQWNRAPAYAPAATAQAGHEVSGARAAERAAGEADGGGWCTRPSLPKHCERVWRQQQGRRREAVFTSGSWPPAVPAARAHARGAGSRPLAARAPRLALQNAHLKLSF